MTPWHGYVDVAGAVRDCQYMRAKLEGRPWHSAVFVMKVAWKVDIQTSALSLSYTGCTLMHIT